MMSSSDMHPNAPVCVYVCVCVCVCSCVCVCVCVPAHESDLTLGSPRPNSSPRDQIRQVLRRDGVEKLTTTGEA